MIVISIYAVNHILWAYDYEENIVVLAKKLSFHVDIVAIRLKQYFVVLKLGCHQKNSK